jgi:hypothetical protein
MMNALEQQVARAAQAVLDANWLGAATQASPRLYPHQWNWDSGFIALGYAHYRPDRALTELESLFDAQWANGMLPHIVYNPAAAGHYFPDAAFWQTDVAMDAPRDLLTSGITQPPVHGFILHRLLECGLDRERVKALCLKVLALHRYLYRNRDPQRLGLVYIRHPWESGTANAPTWRVVLDRIDISRVRVPRYRRTDLEHAPRKHRPTRRDFDRYIHIADIARRARYDEVSIREHCPFLVYDPLFISILTWANEALMEVGTEVGVDTGEVREWHAQTLHALETTLFNPERGLYDAWDLVTDTRLPTQHIAAFSPLICGAPDRQRAADLVSRLQISGFCGRDGHTLHGYPLAALHGSRDIPSARNAAAIWVNISWLLHHGLKRYGFAREAAKVRADIIELVLRHGFHEYFQPRQRLARGETGGFGEGAYSWSAALFLDLVAHSW